MLAEERFAALERVVARANDASADLLIVAGDLFHRLRVPAATIERGASILSQFEGAACLVLPGNHDYRAPDNDRLWRSFSDAAGDRVLVLETPEVIDLAHFDLPIAVLPAPCDSQHSTTHRLDWVTPEAVAGDRTPIGVAHGSLDGITLDSEGHYFPMTHSQLGSLPGAIWIVGHTHRFHWDPANKVLVPGTPEPDGFDVSGGGTAAMVELDADGSIGAVESIDVGRFRFVDATVELADGAAADLFPAERMVERVRAALGQTEVIARISVSGRLGPEAWEAWRVARASVLEDPYVVRLDESLLQRRLTREQVDREYPAGTFAHQLLSDLVQNKDHEAVAAALAIIEQAEQ